MSFGFYCEHIHTYIYFTPIVLLYPMIPGNYTFYEDKVLHWPTLLLFSPWFNQRMRSKDGPKNVCVLLFEYDCHGSDDVIVVKVKDA